MAPSEKLLEVREEALHGRRVEEVGVVVEHAGQPVRGVGQREIEIELRRAGREGERVERDAGELQGGLRKVQDLEADLEERRVPQVALGPQLFDQLREGDALVVVGAERGLADAVHEVSETRIAREIGAQDEHVDEETDQIFHVAVIAVGNRRADGDVGLAGVAVEERLEGREERHEQGGAVVAAEGPQRLGQGGAGTHGAGRSAPGRGSAAAGRWAAQARRRR